MQKTGSLKNKSTVDKLKPISMLSDRLYGSIQTLSTHEPNTPNATATNFGKYQKTNGNKFNMGHTLQSFTRNREDRDEDFVLIANDEDPLAKLIDKAKQLTTCNQHKIEKAKKQLKQQKEKYGTFLTGTGLYESEPEPPIRIENNNDDVDPNELLKSLIHEQQNDDLAELRRMIKATNNNLNGYQKQMYESSQGVIQAADQFKKQLDSGLRYKMNKIKIPENETKNNSTTNNRKAYSVNRIKDPKYM